jgi:hypothetical protein
VRIAKILGKIHTTYFAKDGRIENFISLNKIYQSQTRNHKSIALFEMGYSFPIFVTYHYLARVSDYLDLKKVAYMPDNGLRWKSRIVFWILRLLNLDNGKNHSNRILRSFGISTFLISPKLIGGREFYLEQESILRSGNLSDVLNISFNGLRVGDLFYDWHLRRNGKSTLDFADPQLFSDFRMFCSNISYWDRFFLKKNVKFVFASHAVYVQGIVVRLGLRYGAKVFIVGDDRFNQLSLENFYQDTEHQYYDPGSKTQFGYQIDLGRSEKSIAKLLTGSLEVDVAHSRVSGLSSSSSSTVIEGKSKVRILVAAHCFSDAPHTFGLMHTADFMTWLEDVAVLAKNHPEYEWYAKPHPGFFDSDIVVFSEFLKLNPHLINIPSTVSNGELFTKGINVVLTVHGTISFEAALAGVLVVNCSPVSPHMRYDFVVQPKNLAEFHDIISLLPAYLENHTINRSEVLHFYDVHHLRKNHSWLYREYRTEMLKSCGGYGPHQTNSLTLDYWQNCFRSDNTDIQIIDSLIKYFESDDYLIPFQERYLAG